MGSKDLVCKYIDELTNLTDTFVIDINEKSFEQVETFLQDRQLIIEHLMELSHGQDMKSQEQQTKLNHILSYDALIQSRMLALKDEAQQWLIQRNIARNQRNVYETKYAADSYLMDKRN